MRSELNKAEPKEIKTVLVVGAGAVGGYFGGLLCKGGKEISFLLRPRTYAEVSKGGLTIQSPLGDFRVRPRLIQKASEVDSVDLILLAVKCYDVSSALDQIAPLVEKGALILTLQNGVDTEERVLSYFKKDCAVAGVAYITSRLARPGVIEHYRRGIIALGELSGEESLRVRQIHRLLSDAGITCHLSSQIRKAKWEKLCWNATFNPLSVILEHPISLILETPSLLQVVRDGISEVIAVAEAEGIRLKPNVIEETIAASDQFKEYYTSMYEDYEGGRPTEIEHLNGDLVRRANRRGIAAPIHQTLYALVKGLELKRDREKNLNGI